MHHALRQCKPSECIVVSADDPSGKGTAGPSGPGAVAVGLPQAGTKQEQVSYKDTQISNKERALPADAVKDNVEQGQDIEMQARFATPTIAQMYLQQVSNSASRCEEPESAQPVRSHQGCTLLRAILYKLAARNHLRKRTAVHRQTALVQSSCKLAATLCRHHDIPRACRRRRRRWQRPRWSKRRCRCRLPRW